jgi:hypothetical protein
MNDLERKIYLAVREADEHFEEDGATGTKTWLREYLLPYLEKAGLEIRERRSTINPEEINEALKQGTEDAKELEKRMKRVFSRPDDIVLD